MTSDALPTLEKLLLSPKAFPIMPKLGQALLSSFDQEHISLNQISALIEIDPTLSAKILRLSNAPFYRKSYTLSTVYDALAVIGFSTARSLTLGSIITSAFTPSQSLDMPQFWRISLGTAALARHFSRQKGLAQELAFSAGVLHALGELSMRAAMPISMNTFDTHCTLLDPQRGLKQREFFGFDFSQVGAALSHNWLFPPDLTQCISACGDDMSASLLGPQESLLHLCSWSARRSPFAPSKELSEAFPEHSARACDITLEELTSNPSASDLAAPLLSFIH